MRYQDFSTEDFLKDDFFVTWVGGDNPGANDFWEKWMENHSDRVEYLLAAKQLLKSIDYDRKFELDQNEYTHLYEGIIKGKKHHASKVGRRRIDLSWQIAAAIAFIFCFVGTYWFMEKKETISPVSYITKTNPVGHKSTFQLPDGSVVTLNAGSSLKYLDQFLATNRKVVLEGEAFFDVSKDTKRPFIVKTGNIETQVLGTTFNVNYDAQEERIAVALVTGLVKVEDREGNVYNLKPNEQLICAQSEVQKMAFDTEEVIGWVRGKLIFEQATALEVVKRLEQWYGVNIHTADKKNMFEGKYSGKFDNVSLENVLKGIAYASGFSFEIKEKEVYIK